MSDTLAKFVDDAFKALEASPRETGESPQTPSGVSGDWADSEQPGANIGRFKLLERLGEGGFGTVWKAEQIQPVRRQVALKIVKLGMDTREVIKRFEAERQALAMLDHPHIAKVFDAGATPAGRPYFAMELVRGEPITRHCAREKMPLRERLELFIEACRAMQHAHQKGIIHRDLKPSNLLVSLAGGQAAAPKVIDFGIAKATGGERLDGQSFVTRADRLIGTPAYMSPEQAQPGLDVDTRTDVYSLGVVLYELLTGRVPFEPGPDGKPNRDHAAPRPSTKIRSLTPEQLAQLGATQRLEGPKLIGLVKGDLDWVSMTALAEDRARRYHSADALAEDLRCYLAHEPVSARSPTFGYLLKRFTQRHRLAVGAAAAILLALLAGIAASTWMYLQEKRARVKSEQVSKFLEQVLAQAGPSKALGRDSTMLREILDQTAARIGTELADQPEVQAELRAVLSETYIALQDYSAALAQATEALRLRRLHHHGDEMLAWALYDRARPLIALGRNQEAVESFAEALAIRQRLYGEDHLLTATIRGEMAWPLMNLGRTAEAEQCARLATAYWRKLPDQTLLLGGPRSLGMILHRTHRNEEAVAVVREELAGIEKTVGKEHPILFNTLDNLGYLLLDVQGYDEAEPILREALRQSRKFVPGHAGDLQHIYDSLLRIAAHRQDWDGQLTLAREFVAACRSETPFDPADVRIGCHTLGRVLLEQAERFAETDAPRALMLLDEVEGSPDFAPEVKAAAGWPDCLRGFALAKDPAKRSEARALLARGLDALKKKAQPGASDAQRIKKAEGKLAELGDV